MTYDQVMLAEDDPFDVSYAWLHLGKMDTRYYKVFLVVDLYNRCATVFSCSPGDYAQIINDMYSLAWDSITQLVGSDDVQRTDWERGSRDEFVLYARRLFHDF